MEHAIESIITLPDGRKAEVVEDNNDVFVPCAGCAFDVYFNCQGLACIDDKRTDHKNIIYKEIKED